MADIVKELNEKFRKSITKDGEERVTAAKQKKLDEIKQLDLYRQWKKEKKVLSFPVNYCDISTGDVIYYDELRIPVMVTEKEIRKVYPEYEKKYAYILLDITFKGTIKKVDDDGIVYIQLEETLRNDILKAASSLKSFDTKTALENSLCKRLGEGSAAKTGALRSIVPVVKGIITKVDNDAIYVNIYNVGVTGVVSKKYYRKNYTRNLRDYVRVGQVIKAQVIRYENTDDGKLFILSTVAYVEDPWKTLKNKNFKLKDWINVTVVEKPEGKSYFWCVSDAVPNLEIMSDYTNTFGKNSVHVGDHLTCFIDKIDYEHKFFRVVPKERYTPHQKSIQVIDEV